MTSPALPGALTPAPPESRVREAGRTVRHRITVAGGVQGVGFRPFVHRLASELWLAGYVGNDTGGVFVEVEGSETAVGSFESRLASDAPPLARVERVEAESLAVLGESGFRIVESKPSGAVRTFVSPDVATCDDCVRELFEPGEGCERKRQGKVADHREVPFPAGWSMSVSSCSHMFIAVPTAASTGGERPIPSSRQAGWHPST